VLVQSHVLDYNNWGETQANPALFTMSRVLIYLHADPAPADFETSDAPTIDALRSSFPSPSNLVMASELERALRPIRPLWAKRLEGMEEASMVTVKFED
jgi:hypothetical protein